LKDEEEKPRTKQKGWKSLGRLRSNYKECNVTEQEEEESIIYNHCIFKIISDI
jgi:hypothetical protein